MTAELGIYMQGPRAGTDALATFKAAQALLDVLAELERLENPQDHRERSAWGFTRLALGSFDCALKPLEIKGKTTFDDLDAAALRLVQGFESAEERAELPTGWTMKAAEAAARAASALGASQDFGMCLSVFRNGAEEAIARVSSRAGENLRTAIRTRYKSVGSLCGHLGNVSDRPLTKATLWDEVTDTRVIVHFTEAHREAVRQAWGEDHVEVSGVIEENAYGQPLSIRMEDLEVLKPRDLTAEEIEGGFYPDMTGGLSVEEHLAVMRGEA